MFLIRIPCHKTTHANGYHGAWPGWAAAVSVLPLTEGPLFYLLGLLTENFAQSESWELCLFG